MFSNDVIMDESKGILTMRILIPREPLIGKTKEELVEGFEKAQERQKKEFIEGVETVKKAIA